MQTERLRVTLANGQTKTPVFSKRGFAFNALHLPASFSGTAITFESADAVNGTYLPVYKSDGTQVSLTVAASRVVSLVGDAAAALAPCENIKIVSGTAQSGDCVITVLQAD